MPNENSMGFLSPMKCDISCCKIEKNGTSKENGKSINFSFNVLLLLLQNDIFEQQTKKEEENDWNEMRRRIERTNQFYVRRLSAAFIWSDDIRTESRNVVLYFIFFRYFFSTPLSLLNGIWVTSEDSLLFFIFNFSFFFTFSFVWQFLLLNLMKLLLAQADWLNCSQK